MDEKCLAEWQGYNAVNELHWFLSGPSILANAAALGQTKLREDANSFTGLQPPKRTSGATKSPSPVTALLTGAKVGEKKNAPPCGARVAG
jgi:hypothetical protein